MVSAKQGFLLARVKRFEMVFRDCVFFAGPEISEDCRVHAIRGVHRCSRTGHAEIHAQGRGRRRTHNQSAHGTSGGAPRFSFCAACRKTSGLSHACATRPSQENDLKKTVDESARIRRAYGHYFDLTIVNNNLDKAFDTLQDAVARLFVEPQWVPVSWVYWRPVWPLTTTEVGFNTLPLWRWLSHKNCISKLSHLEPSGRTAPSHAMQLSTHRKCTYLLAQFAEISKKTLTPVQCLVSFFLSRLNRCLSCFNFEVVYLFYRYEGWLLTKNNTSVSQFTVHMPVCSSHVASVVLTKSSVQCQIFHLFPPQGKSFISFWTQ